MTEGSLAEQNTSGDCGSNPTSDQSQRSPQDWMGSGNIYIGLGFYPTFMLDVFNICYLKVTKWKAILGTDLGTDLLMIGNK